MKMDKKKATGLNR